MKTHFDFIVDGLAEHGFSIVDQFLSQEEVDNIIKELNHSGIRKEFKKAGIGKDYSGQINENIRGDQIHWLEKSTASPAVLIYLERMTGLLHYVNETLFLSLKEFEVHLTKYPPGSFYKRHRDQFKRDDHRKLSVICYLNPDWKEEYGGQLRIYLPEREMDILPIAGRLVCFRSDQIEHEVLPTTRERLSITGWLLDQLIDLKHL